MPLAGGTGNKGPKQEWPGQSVPWLTSRVATGSPDWLSDVQSITTVYATGITTFDTSKVYSNEQSEVVLGKAIKQENLPRDRMVVMTKVFHPARLNMEERVDGKEEKATEYATTHRYPNRYSLTREMQAFTRLKQGGQTVTPGNSLVDAMQNHAVKNDLTPFISMQNDYNILYHQDEHKMVPTLKVLSNVSFLPLSSLVHGAMTMPLDQQLALPSDNMCVSSSLPRLPIHWVARVPEGRNEWHNTIITTGNAMIQLEEIALQQNVTMTQMTIARSMSKEHVRALIISGLTTGQPLDTIRTMP
ncbi:Aldo/keto reductase [Armillaria luteobubalina]|uniref:Aldo/keto reductase n=1 Tax=Armillaria luteobubalina TaxID=153913 RepID=A0AA39P3F1_9AGAR|nr:Aldo/keto reductase [Armillaria luteobubalina]